MEVMVSASLSKSRSFGKARRVLYSVRCDPTAALSRLSFGLRERLCELPGSLLCNCWSLIRFPSNSASDYANSHGQFYLQPQPLPCASHPFRQLLAAQLHTIAPDARCGG